MMIKFCNEFYLWENKLALNQVQSSQSGAATNQRNNQQPNDLMSRSAHRRLLCDGSFRQDIQREGIGVISLNPKGQDVDGVAGQFFCRTSNVAEAKVVYAACILATREGGKADVWSNCKEVVDACHSSLEECPWECAGIVAAVQEIMKANPCIEVHHCLRQHVAAALLEERETDL
ncbi:hypothetical protein LINGRAHAP2_LOCUS14962 [Linum grandiflorum]